VGNQTEYAGTALDLLNTPFQIALEESGFDLKTLSNHLQRLSVHKTKKYHRLKGEAKKRTKINPDITIEAETDKEILISTLDDDASVQLSALEKVIKALDINLNVRIIHERSSVGTWMLLGCHQRDLFSDLGSKRQGCKSN